MTISWDWYRDPKTVNTMFFGIFWAESRQAFNRPATFPRP